MNHKTILLLLLLTATAGFAQKAPQQALDMSIKAGVNVGGASPRGIPAEVREIKTFSLILSPCIAADAVYWLTPKWGAGAGLCLERKRMATTANVKEYAMQLGGLHGAFTGDVQAKVSNSYLSIPLLAHYRASASLNLRAGFYYAYLTAPSFTGEAYDGQFRTGPSGQEVNMDMREPSAYAFSNELNRHDFGLSGGVEWQPYRHVTAGLDLTWGLRPIFPSDFTGIGMTMYNVYSKWSVGYRF
ncbi:MAG: PorT family protein [Prevotellaceae bacterium]|jgi:hypothetical protein|nr:PorT family protein [Prevotellaceae bacterium]